MNIIVYGRKAHLISLRYTREADLIMLGRRYPEQIHVEIRFAQYQPDLEWILAERNTLRFCMPPDELRNLSISGIILAIESSASEIIARKTVLSGNSPKNQYYLNKIVDYIANT